MAFLGAFLILNWVRFGDLLFLLSSILIFSGIYALIIGLTKEGKFLWGFIREIIGARV